MRTILCLLLLASSAFGQIIVSTTDTRCTGVLTLVCTYTQRETGPTPWAIQFQITGTGTISRGSCTPSDPGYFNNPCPSGNGGFSLTFNPATAPSTGSAYTNGFFNNGTTAAQPTLSWTQVIVGSSGCTSGCSVTFILNVVALTNPSFTSPAYGPSFPHCVNTSPIYPTADKCTPPDGVTPGPTPFNMFVGVGNTYTDSTFGGTIRQLTNSPPYWRVLDADSLNSMLNKDGTKVLTSGMGGDVHVVDTTSGADTPIAACGEYYWSSLNANVIYSWGSGCGLTIYQITLPSTTPVAIYTYPTGPGNTQISSGNDMQLSKDEWACFTPNDESHTVLINLGVSPPVAYVSPTWPNNAIMHMSNPSGTGDGNSRLCAMTVGINTANNKRYFDQEWDANGGISFNAIAEVYSLTTGSSTVVDEGILGGAEINSGQSGYTSACADRAQFGAGQCFGALVGHKTTVEANGIQYYVWGEPANTGALGFYQGNVLFMARWDQMAGGVTPQAAEAGGGLYAVFPYGGGDEHMSAAKNAPLIAMGIEYDSNNVGSSVYPLPAWNITAATGSGVSPVNITTDNAYSGANADSILVNGTWCAPSSGNTANTVMNGVQTVSGLSGTTLDLLGTTGACTFSRHSLQAGGNNTGSFVKNVTLDRDSFMAELDTIDLSHIADKVFTIHRQGIGRAVAIADQNTDSYFGQMHVVVSADGHLIAFESNNGNPGVNAVFSITSGYQQVGTTMHGVTVHGLTVH